MQINKIVVAILFLGILAGCTAPGTYMSVGNVVNTPIKINGAKYHAKVLPIDAHAIATQRPYFYRVGPFDVLDIVVWNHPELTMADDSSKSNSVVGSPSLSANLNNSQPSGILVDAHGKIFYPFAGRLFVAGLTVEQIRLLLSKRLSRYIRKPQVSVRVSTYRSDDVNVIGEVLHPGTVPLSDKPLTLLTAINSVGGIDQQSADTGHIYIFRNHHGKPIIYWMYAKSPQKLLLAERFILRPNDVIYIAPAGVVGWNRIISQVLPTIQTIWYTHAVTQ